MKKNFLIVVANYYKDISKGLLKSAIDSLPKSSKIKTINVPGVFEIPITISKNINKYDCFIALGCVIKGQTPHFDFISQASTDAIMKLSIENKTPISITKNINNSFRTIGTTLSHEISKKHENFNFHRKIKTYGHK